MRLFGIKATGTVSDPEVKPALTAEELASIHERHLDGYVALPDGFGNITHLELERAPAIAAACLYGQPFGFTWEDVDMCLEMAAEDEAVAAHQPHAPHGWRSRWRGLADRIAALLPPRETT